MSNAVKEIDPKDVQTEMPEETRSRPVFVPRADIYESAEQIVVLADMPGVNENTVDITLEKNVLTIHGVVAERDMGDRALVYAEYNIGDFRRVFNLPNEIDRNGIQATVKNGTLKLVLPKSKEALPKKISVTSG